MLQNRVDPFGNLIRTPARGAWMGNRGLLHGADQELVRYFRLKAWLICKLDFKERRRVVMSPGQYTELFFLDEATAFSAGHRPCFECRRPDFNRFKSYWLEGNRRFGFNEQTPISRIDEVLHAERINRYGLKVTFTARGQDIPNGSFVLIDGEPCLVNNNTLHLWSPMGYTSAMPLPKGDRLTVLTPRSTVNAFRAGYPVQMALA